jgi:hypothetical protein
MQRFPFVQLPVNTAPILLVFQVAQDKKGLDQPAILLECEGQRVLARVGLQLHLRQEFAEIDQGEPGIDKLLELDRAGRAVVGVQAWHDECPVLHADVLAAPQQSIHAGQTVLQLPCPLLQPHRGILGRLHLAADLRPQGWPAVPRDQVGFRIRIAPAAREPDIASAQRPAQLPEHA